MIGASHLALVSALAACLTGIGGFAYGVRVGTAQEQAAEHRAQAKADKVRGELQSQIDASAQQHQANQNARQAGVREIYHDSQKIIERPVYGTVCVDADGVGLLDRAAATANGEGLAPAAGAPAGAAEGTPQP